MLSMPGVDKKKEVGSEGGAGERQPPEVLLVCSALKRSL